MEPWCVATVDKQSQRLVLAVPFVLLFLPCIEMALEEGPVGGDDWTASSSFRLPICRGVHISQAGILVLEVKGTS